jgi:hypothetical protein
VHSFDDLGPRGTKRLLQVAAPPGEVIDDDPDVGPAPFDLPNELERTDLCAAGVERADRVQDDGRLRRVRIGSAQPPRIVFAEKNEGARSSRKSVRG